MNEQRGVDLAGTNGLERARVGADWHDDGLEAGQEQAQDQVRRRSQARNADASAVERREIARVRRDDDRSVAAPDGHAVRESKIVARDRRVARDRDGDDVELAGGRARVERLGVGSIGLEDEPLGIDLAGQERPEHEDVVAVGRECEADPHGARP